MLPQPHVASRAEVPINNARCPVFARWNVELLPFITEMSYIVISVATFIIQNFDTNKQVNDFEVSIQGLVAMEAWKNLDR